MKKDDKIQKKIFPYDFPVELETRAHGNIVARCPQLPGCQAQGSTPKEALEKLKNVLDLYFASATPAFFEGSEAFDDLQTLYALCDYRGYLYAATGRDQVLRSSSGAPGSWKKIPVTKMNSKFFTPTPNRKDGAGDYAAQIYCLAPFAAPGKESVLFAGTNVNGAIYQSADGENWREAFSSGEDRVHTLCAFKNRLYAGTSSRGRVFAYDGTQWNTVGSLSEVAVTCLGVFKDRLYAGTYSSGLIFATPDGLNWEEMTGTGQTFVQCFKEFNGAFYAGTSSSKGVKIFRTKNGRDWIPVYESTREANCYSLEVFENALYAGTGNSGRILKTSDGEDWTTAYAGDSEGVRTFAIFNDYLYAGTENEAALLRSTFDMARMPSISDLKVEKLTSSSALLTWTTDISSTSEVHYAEKRFSPDLRRCVTDKGQELRHRIHLTDLKAETEYEFRVVSAYRSSSLSVSQNSSFKTPAVWPPALSSPSHPPASKWEKDPNIIMHLNPATHLAGYHYVLDHEPKTTPTPPSAIFTDDKRVALNSVAQGVWYFHVVGEDEAGNIGTTTAHFKIQVDTEALPPPMVTSSTHPQPEKWVANPTPVIAWDLPTDLSGVKGFFVKADHEPATVPGPGTGEFTLENRLTLGPLEDGLWYVHITTQDKAGNVGTLAAHYAIRIDTKAVAPVLSSPTHPQQEQWYSNNKLEVVITPPHDLSGIEGYYYVINTEPQTMPDPNSSPFTDKTKIVFSDLKDGVWYVHVRAKDKAENLSPQAGHFKVLVDTQASPPQVTSPTHAEPVRWYNDRRVVLNWEDPFEHSGIEGYYYNIDRKSDTVPNDKTSLFTTQRTVSFELTDDGLWYFHITSKDKAGNLDWKAVHYPLRVDSEVSKPFLASPTHPEQEIWYSRPKASFKIIPPDDLSGVTGYYYSFTEDPKSLPDPKKAAFTDKTELNLDIPRDGVHTLAVICQDAAGNTSKEAAYYRVRLDTTVGEPEIASPSHPDATKWYPSRRLELTWKDPADLSGIEGFYIASSHEENWTGDPKTMSWTTSRGTVLTLPEDGVWYIHICAKDRAENIGPVVKYKVQIDSQALAPEIKSPTHPLNQWVKATTPKFMWEEPKELSGVEGYYASLDSQPHSIPGPGNGKWITETSLTAPALKDGRWYFHLTTKDKVGNLSKEAAHYAVLIDTQPPKSTLKPLPPVIDKTKIGVEWGATDPLSDVVSFDVQVKTGENGAWADWLMDVSDQSGVFNGKDGTRYAFRVRAKDGAGNQEAYPQNEMASVTVDISPPASITQLKATPKAGGDIELKWSPVADKISGTDYYRVYRWVEGEPKVKISMDGDVKGIAFTDDGGKLKENVVYYYCVQAVDRMGNEQHEGNQTAACLSDHGVGSPVVTSPTHSLDDWSSNASPILVWDAPADATGIAGYYYVLDQSPNTRPDPETATFTDGRRAELTDLASGIWYFHLLAKDKAGNVSPEPARYRLKIDREKPSAPQITSTSHPDSRTWYSANRVQAKLTAAPKISGVDSFYVVFDRSPETQPAPNEAQRVTEPEMILKASEPGVWYLHAVVKDKAGNFSEPTHFRVQTAAGEMPPPVVSSPTHPREDEAVNHHDPLFTWEDRHDGSFTPEGYVYKLSHQENDYLTAEDFSTSERSVQLKDIEEGTWYFHVAAVGKNGNPGPLASKRKVIIRRLGKAQGTFLRKDGVTPVSGAKVELVKGDRQAASAITDPKGAFSFSGLPEGRYELRLHSDQYPVLRLKDLPITSDEGLSNAVFTEDMGIFPTPPGPGPIRFYYFLKEDCNVTLEVFDSAGTLVGKVEEKKEGGAYAVTLWDAAGKPAGEYLYKLSAKSVTKNAMSRFSVKKFRIEKPSKELTAQTV